MKLLDKWRKSPAITKTQVLVKCMNRGEMHPKSYSATTQTTNCLLGPSQRMQLHQKASRLSKTKTIWIIWLAKIRSQEDHYMCLEATGSMANKEMISITKKALTKVISTNSTSDQTKHSSQGRETRRAKTTILRSDTLNLPNKELKTNSIQSLVRTIQTETNHRIKTN